MILHAHKSIVIKAFLLFLGRFLHCFHMTFFVGSPNIHKYFSMLILSVIITEKNMTMHV